jgi:exodeoxyribonuclease V beta subunit
VIGARLRDRYDVVLIDEFQDTDPVQWRIMQRAFGVEGRTLIVIADPKQAIYAFRGADVYAYLEAARSAVAHATLGVNRRSDQPLIDAYDALFDGAQLGHPGIVYRQVRAAPAHQAPRLSGAPRDAPLRIRVVQRDQPSVALTRAGYVNAPSARQHVAEDLAADLVSLLSSGAKLECRAPDGTPAGRAAVRPGHIAVLVRTNRNAALIRDELEQVGIPAVINGAGSVFGTPPAREWLRLLEALERPTSSVRAKTAALTCFVGWSAEQVAAAGDAESAELHRRLHDWARVVRAKGVAALLETVTLAERLPQRILAVLDGERRITDLRHVGQLLHTAAADEQLGITALTAWLRRRIAEAEADTGDEERSRRLESDAEAVQVLTIHRSKGLEFPIVYAPFLWETAWMPPDPRPVVFHDAAAGDARTIDVSLEGPDYRRHREQYIVEERGEELRLAYVALTRALHQAVVWWAPSYDSRHSPLGRLLFARNAATGAVAPAGGSTPTDAAAMRRFGELADAAPGRISVERAVLGPDRRWSQPLELTDRLEAEAFQRSLDWRWRRTSYSDITAGAHEALVLSEPEEPAVVVDEPGEAPAVPRAAGPELVAASGAEGAAPSGAEGAAAPSPLAGMGSGVRVGTFVHRVLEATDFAAADLDAELSEHVSAALAWRSVDLGERSAVTAGLRAAIETPLGPLLGGLRLRDMRREDRLDELGFELPLVGGDEPTGQLTVAAIADVLRAHAAPGDPLAGYADRLADPALRTHLRGYLTGSLDLVIRVRGAAPDAPARFAVIDYKTNRLAGPDEPLTLWHYRPEALASEMYRSHYGLQALLYAVALHRYLRWRLPGYEPGRNLAGVLYLFVRGMSGPAGPTAGSGPYGVFSWQPRPALVEALSEVLDRGTPGNPLDRRVLGNRLDGGLSPA